MSRGGYIFYWLYWLYCHGNGQVGCMHRVPLDPTLRSALTLNLVLLLQVVHWIQMGLVYWRVLPFPSVPSCCALNIVIKYCIIAIKTDFPRHSPLSRWRFVGMSKGRQLSRRLAWSNIGGLAEPRLVLGLKRLQLGRQGTEPVQDPALRMLEQASTVLRCFRDCICSPC